MQGRKLSLGEVRSKIAKNDKVIWMHAASLGEYEQGVPVLEKLKEKYPDHKTLVTFFSPSGYDNVMKKPPIADVLCYLPFDEKPAISEFVKAVHPDIFFTVKYDFWYHLLEELKKHKVKVFVISALFYRQQPYFKCYGKWMVKALQKKVDWIFHQTQDSYFLAKSIGLTKASVSGDTRFDRVKQTKESDHSLPFIEGFKAQKNLLVVGSSWEAEERIARLVAQQVKDFKIIIAPHDLKRVGTLQKIFPEALLYGDMTPQQSPLILNEANILIIDSIGLLSKIYSYADVAIVGGGFHGKGLHNILEAATFGVPVFLEDIIKRIPKPMLLLHKMEAAPSRMKRRL